MKQFIKTHTLHFHVRNERFYLHGCVFSKYILFARRLNGHLTRFTNRLNSIFHLNNLLLLQLRSYIFILVCFFLFHFLLRLVQTCRARAIALKMKPICFFIMKMVEFC